MIEWDITQWLDFVAGTEDAPPAGGLGYASWSAMGPTVTPDIADGSGWFVERTMPSNYYPKANDCDPVYINCLAEAKFPRLGPHRMFTQFASDGAMRDVRHCAPRNAGIADWLNANCTAGEIVWASTMLSDPFGGIALISLWDEEDFVLAKLRFKEQLVDWAH